MTDDFKIDTQHIHNMQKQIREMSTRAIPIAIQQTLTATARHAWKYGRTNTTEDFTNRSSWIKRSQNWDRAEGLDPDRMVAKVGTTDDGLTKQEHGFTRKGKDGNGVWVPTAEASGQQGERTKPVLARFRRGRVRMKRKIRKKATSAKQQRFLNIYNSVATSTGFWGKLGQTRGMWLLSGSVDGGRVNLTGVHLLYSANKRTIHVKKTEWHLPSVQKAITRDEPREYDKALKRQLKRLKAKYKTK